MFLDSGTHLVTSPFQREGHHVSFLVLSLLLTPSPSYLFNLNIFSLFNSTSFINLSTLSVLSWDATMFTKAVNFGSIWVPSITMFYVTVSCYTKILSPSCDNTFDIPTCPEILASGVKTKWFLISLSYKFPTPLILPYPGVVSLFALIFIGCPQAVPPPVTLGP